MPKAAIAGVAALPVQKHIAESIRDSATTVALDALADAGLGIRDVDGLFCTPPALNGPPGFMWSCTFAHHLGVQTHVQSLVECGGMTATLALDQALRAVADGRCQTALVVASDRRAIDSKADIEDFLKQAAIGLVGLYGPYDGLYGIGAPIPYYAMSAQRYLHEYGATEADLAEVAVTLRNFAVDNPRAEHRAPITVDDVLGSKPIAPPLKLLDCSSFASGAAAVVVTTEDIAKSAPQAPVFVTGVGEHHEPSHFAELRRPLTTFEAATRSAQKAYEAAGRGPADIDVAEVYGVFSATELILYEDLGFFDKGRAVEAMRDGRTRGEGNTVFNPSGGRLSMGHPAGVTPLLSAIEVVEQLRGDAGPRQVKDARVGLVHSEHGMLNGSMVMILEAA